MGTTPNQIQAHIERTRDALGSNLNELEEKVKSATDWEQHFRNRTGTSLALAFGGGLLLAAVFGGRSKRSSRQCLPTAASRTAALPLNSRESGVAHEAWDTVKSALVGVAATRLLGYAEEVFPSLRKKAERTVESAPAADSGAVQQQPSKLWTGNQNT